MKINVRIRCLVINISVSLEHYLFIKFILYENLTLPYLTLPTKISWYKLIFFVCMSALGITPMKAQCTHPIVVGSNVGVPTMSVAVSLGLLTASSGTISSQNFRISGNFLIDFPRTLVGCDVQVESNGFVEFISTLPHFINNTSIKSCGIGHDMEIVGASIVINSNSHIECREFRVYETQFTASTSTFSNTNFYQSQTLEFDFTTTANIALCTLENIRLEVKNNSSLDLSNSYINGDLLFNNSIFMDGQAVYRGSNNHFDDMHTIMRTGLNSGFKWARETGSLITRPWTASVLAFYYSLDDFSLFEFYNNTINSLGLGIRLSNSLGFSYIQDNTFNYDPNHAPLRPHPGISIVGGTHADIGDNSLHGSIHNILNSKAKIYRNELEGHPTQLYPEGILTSTASDIQITNNTVSNYTKYNFQFINSSNVSARYNNSTGAPISFEVDESKSTTLTCNNISYASTYGLGVYNNCIGLIHRGSTFNHVFKGLFYNTMYINNNQTNHGNRFFNYTIGAELIGNASGNQYIVNPNVPEEYPLPFTPSNFFILNGTSSYKCLSEDPPRDTIELPDLNGLHSMVLCATEGDPYVDGNCFAQLQTAYRLISIHLDEIESSELVSFHASNSTGIIGTLPTPMEIAEALSTARIEMPSTMHDLISDNSEGGDYFSNVMEIGELWFEEARSSKENIIQSFRSKLQGVEAHTSLIEDNVYIVQALLDFYQYGYRTTFDSERLSLIASGCIYQYGNAVYTSRSLCEALNIEYSKSNIEECASMSAQVEAHDVNPIQFQTEAKETINVLYPNPAKDIIQINRSIEFRIMDTLGNFVTSGFSANGIISIQNLPSGMYLIQDVADQAIYKFIKL